MRINKHVGIIIFIFTFLMGIVFTLLCKDTYFKWTEKSIWQGIPDFKVNGRWYLLYLAEKKLPPFIVLWVMGSTMFGIPIIFLTLAWIGCALGMILTISFICSGVSGIAVMILSMFPHGVLYLYGMIRICNLILGYHGKESSEHHLTVVYKKKSYDRMMQKVLPIWILSIIFECYIAPIWLNKLITFFL